MIKTTENYSLESMPQCKSYERNITNFKTLVFEWAQLYLFLFFFFHYNFGLEKSLLGTEVIHSQPSF